MTKSQDTNCRYYGAFAKPRAVAETPYFEIGPQSLASVRDNLKLKKLLKRAVENENAPQSLIDSIRAKFGE